MFQDDLQNYLAVLKGQQGTPAWPVSPPLSDQDQAQQAAEAAAARLKAPYNAANARTSGLPQVLDLLGGQIKDALKAPMDAYQGNFQVSDPETGMPTPEAMSRAQGVAGLATLGGMPMAERGALGMSGGKMVQPEPPPIKIKPYKYYSESAAGKVDYDIVHPQSDKLILPGFNTPEEAQAYWNKNHHLDAAQHYYKEAGVGDPGETVMQEALKAKPKEPDMDAIVNEIASILKGEPKKDPYTQEPFEEPPPIPSNAPPAIPKADFVQGAFGDWGIYHPHGISPLAKGFSSQGEAQAYWAATHDTPAMVAKYKNMGEDDPFGQKAEPKSPPIEVVPNSHGAHDLVHPNGNPVWYGHWDDYGPTPDDAKEFFYNHLDKETDTGKYLKDSYEKAGAQPWSVTGALKAKSATPDNGSMLSAIKSKPKPLSNTDHDFIEAQKVGEQPSGSNTGGIYQTPKGKWYIKEAPSEEHAANEKLGNELYKVAGANTPWVKNIQFQGKPAVASRIVNDAKPLHQASDLPPAQLAERLASDVWLKNYDAIGTHGDNLLVDKWGNAHRIDQGATLNYRANGSLKDDPLTADASQDWKLMTHPNPSELPSNWAVSKYAKAMQNMPRTAIQKSVWRLSGVSDDEIFQTVRNHFEKSPSEQEALAEKLIKRRDSILKAAEGSGYKPQPTTRQESMDTFFPTPLLRGSRSNPHDIFGYGTGVDTTGEGFFGVPHDAKDLADLYSRNGGHPESRYKESGPLDYGAGSNIWPMRWNTENFLHVDAGGRLYTEPHEGYYPDNNGGIMYNAVKQARKEGRDGVVVHNVHDEPDSSSKHLSPKDVYIATNPRAVRSQTGAAFNPKKWRVEDYLANFGGVAVPAGLAGKFLTDKNGKGKFEKD